MENTIMAILLHNLVARAPKLSDADAVTSLLKTCDIVEDGVSHYTEEDVLAEWQGPDFNLATDAWAIITNKGQFVGYAITSWNNELMRVNMQACVHPSYRGRGIGTLLLRLAEVRARQFAKYARPGVRVALNNMVSHTNQRAKDLLEHEGYTLVSHSWRIIIETEDIVLPASATSTDYQQLRKHTLTLDVSFPCATGTTRIYEPSGWYAARQYDVYEKELRAGDVLYTDELLGMGMVTCP
jgi:GNAT superfamily N-acetyltransferase